MHTAVTTPANKTLVEKNKHQYPVATQAIEAQKVTDHKIKRTRYCKTARQQKENATAEKADIKVELYKSKQKILHPISQNTWDTTVAAPPRKIVDPAADDNVGVKRQDVTQTSREDLVLNIPNRSKKCSKPFKAPKSNHSQEEIQPTSHSALRSPVDSFPLLKKTDVAFERPDQQVRVRGCLFSLNTNERCSHCPVLDIN